ncbi:MAG: rod shape-determining protein RodA [Chloroflexota bacterium]
MELRLWRNFDFLLFLTALVLVAIGLAAIYSASLPTTHEDDELLEMPVVRQAISAGLGLVLMLVLARVDYRFLGSVSPFLYFVALALLAAVLVIGDSTYGAARWIDFGIVPLQPSEIAKIIMVAVLGKYLADHREQLRYPVVALVSLIVVAVPSAMVYLQPDLGTMVIFAVIWVAIVIMAGIRPLHLASLFVVALLAIPFAYVFLLHDYMRERIATFFNPVSDPLGTGYNIMQSAISVGSGGFWGKGFTQGTQSQLHFLRIQKTDFIFSVFAEEMGFIGAIVLFTLFVILLLRGVRIASISSDVYGRLMAVGIVAMILFQVFINVGVNVKLLPVTGVPLPFISYGGNALITDMAALGILQSIAMRRKGREMRKV